MSVDPDRGDDIAFFATYIDENWEESIPQRDVDIPKPEIVAEGERDRRATNFSDNDIVIVNDGGTVTYEPASVGFRDYKVVAPYDITIRTNKGYPRFDGTPASVNYSGLSGEVRRLLDSLRFGFGPYDQVIVQTFDDNTSAYGADVFEAIWAIECIAYADPIAQSADIQ